MNYHRRHGTLPSYLLWALVVIGDLMLVVVNAGVTMLITLLCLATGGGVAACASRMRRQATTAMPIKRDA
jgi:TRAP-type mannitol/chloroaromatic compound transport system permease small subunit